MSFRARLARNTSRFLISSPHQKNSHSQRLRGDIELSELVLCHAGGKWIGINYEDHALALTNIADHHEKLTHIVSVVEKVIVDVASLTIEIRLPELCRYIEEMLEIRLPLNADNDILKLVLPYHTRRSKKGTVVVRPGKIGDKPHDIFDLPPIELKNLVRGIVWRNEHFKGQTIRQIADREKLSEGFVGRLIHYSLELC